MKSQHLTLCLCIVVLVITSSRGQDSTVPAPAFTDDAQQLMKKYCFDCHDTSSKEGVLDLAALQKSHG